jgi:hypothetical protein
MPLMAGAIPPTTQPQTLLVGFVTVSPKSYRESTCSSPSSKMKEEPPRRAPVEREHKIIDEGQFPKRKLMNLGCDLPPRNTAFTGRPRWGEADHLGQRISRCRKTRSSPISSGRCPGHITRVTPRRGVGWIVVEEKTNQ